MRQFGIERKAIKEGLGKIKDVPSVVYGKVDVRHRDAPRRRSVRLPHRGEERQVGRLRGRENHAVTLGPWFDYTINGLVVGNIYALLAVGLALIYGVSHLINFAHGSIYMVGAYIGWLCITYLGTPLPVTLARGRDRLRPARHGDRAHRACGRCRARRASRRCSPPSASGWCSTRWCSFCSRPTRAACRCKLPDWRIQIGGGTIGALDILIAGIGL